MNFRHRLITSPSAPHTKVTFQSSSNDWSGESGSGRNGSEMIPRPQSRFNQGIKTSYFGNCWQRLEKFKGVARCHIRTSCSKLKEAAHLNKVYNLKPTPQVPVRRHFSRSARPENPDSTQNLLPEARRDITQNNQIFPQQLVPGSLTRNPKVQKSSSHDTQLTIKQLHKINTTTTLLHNISVCTVSLYLQHQLIETNSSHLQPPPHLNPLIEETGWWLYLIATSAIPISWNSGIPRPYLPAIQVVSLHRHLRLTSLSRTFQLAIQSDQCFNNTSTPAWKKGQLKARSRSRPPLKLLTHDWPQHCSSIDQKYIDFFKVHSPSLVGGDETKLEPNITFFVTFLGLALKKEPRLA